MKTSLALIFFFILILHAQPSDSQSGCTVPASPALRSVTIQPETGKTELKWTSSPSTGISAYIIYTYSNGDGLPIDTIWDPSATSYSYSTTASKYFSLSYVVSALRLPDCESPLSNAINTIFCTPLLDTCKKQISLKWNKYPDLPVSVSSYEIIITKGGIPLPGILNLSPQLESYIYSAFESDFQYCFTVKATMQDGSVSYSNKSCISTRMQRTPAWINADFATVTPENKILLSYTIDPLSKITRYRLERKTGPAGSYQQIAEISSAANKISYTDNDASPDVQNIYRLSAINNCNLPVVVSNISGNISLKISREGNNIKLAWNSYKKWIGNLAAYYLYFKTGNGLEQLAVLPPGDSTYTLSYNEIMNRITTADVCFRIKAVESGNPYGINGESQSSESCSRSEELITVPNLFTPDEDLINDRFKPVLSFLPVNYYLVITDRKGKIFFETRSESADWDGSIDGYPAPQDVYLWYLRVTGPSGKLISKTGTVTIVRN